MFCLFSNRKELEYILTELKLSEQELIDLFNGDVLLDEPEIVSIVKLMKNMSIDLQDTDVETGLELLRKYREKVLERE